MSKFIGLSIDSGGFKGIIPSYLISKLESDLDKQSFELFKMIVGTSTGGIIAAALAKGIKAETILNLYKNDGISIFKRSLWYKISSGDGILNPKYPLDGLEKTIMNYLSNDKISTRKVDFVVTGYDTNKDEPILFKSWKNNDYTFSEVAIATAAAPTYFPSYKRFVDGGIFANNPALIMFIEALKLGYKIEDIIIVSIGTGEYTYSFDSTKWGIKEWLIKSSERPLIDIMFKGQSKLTNYILNYLLNDNFIRLDIEIPKELRAMDDTSKKDELIKYGEKLTNSEQYKTVINLLK